MAVTMKDIAAASGVSRSVVSLVLNDRDREMGIARPTRERILRTAEKLGYCRNELARAVVTGHSRVVAWISGCDIGGHEYVARISSGISRVLSEAGYSMKTFYLLHTATDVLVRQLRENQIAGVICHATSYTELKPLLTHLRQLQIPAVVANLSATEFGYGVITDDADGVAQAVSHLAQAGHRRIAYLGSPGALEYVVNRRHGFHTRVARLQLEGRAFALPESVTWRDNIRNAMDQIREAGFRAVIAETDAMAAVIMQWAFDRRLRVPEELSVVGFADMSFAAWCMVPLTTVAQPLDRLGATAAERLLTWIAHPEPEGFTRYQNITLPVELVIRQSVYPLQ